MVDITVSVRITVCFSTTPTASVLLYVIIKLKLQLTISWKNEKNISTYLCWRVIFLKIWHIFVNIFYKQYAKIVYTKWSNRDTSVWQYKDTCKLFYIIINLKILNLRRIFLTWLKCIMDYRRFHISCSQIISTPLYVSGTANVKSVCRYTVFSIQCIGYIICTWSQVAYIILFFFFI